MKNPVLRAKNGQFFIPILGKKGGHVYVCGDAKMMAKDVHNIIVEVVQKGKMK